MANKPRRYHDPVISLNKQFSKLMYGRGAPHITGDRKDKKTGKWKFVQNRYAKGSRLYQMQVDYMYLIKEVQDRGRNPYFVKQTQKFINECAAELGVEISR